MGKNSQVVKNHLVVSDYMEVFISEVLRSYQRDWLLSMLTSKYTGILSSRQVGKSLSIAVASLMLATGYITQEQKVVEAHNVFIVSKDLKTAKNIISMINQIIKNMENIYEVKLTMPQLGGISEVVLWNGRKIISMPGTPTSLQGFTGSVIIDELSANSWDVEELMAQALSISSSREDYKVITCTNADLEGSYVHNMWFSDKEPWVSSREAWKLHSLNIYEVYPDGLPETLLQIKKTMAKNMWLRFFENIFLGEGTGLLDPEYLRGHIKEVPSTPCFSYYIGIDPGFSESGNPTGIVLVGIYDKVAYVIEENLLWSPTPEEVESYVDRLKKEYKVRRIFIDPGTVGYHLHKSLERKYGSSIVCSASMNSKNQYSWFISLTQMLEQGSLKLTKDSYLLQDLCSISLSGESLIVPERPVSVYNPVEGYVPKKGNYKIHADSAMALLTLVPVLTESTISKPSYGALTAPLKAQKRISRVQIGGLR